MGIVVFILVYVHDIMKASKSGKAAEAARDSITCAFKAREMGHPTYLLGLHVDRHTPSGSIQLGQRKYVATLLDRFNLLDAKLVRLPMGAGDHLSQEEAQLLEEQCMVCQDLVGALLYLSTCTRPDIAFTVGCLWRHVAKPTATHLIAAETVLRYLKGMATLALTYGEEAILVGYCDAYYAGDKETQRSTTGFLFILNGAAVSWGSKRQATVSHSTTEAE